MIRSKFAKNIEARGLGKRQRLFVSGRPAGKLGVLTFCVIWIFEPTQRGASTMVACQDRCPYIQCPSMSLRRCVLFLVSGSKRKRSEIFGECRAELHPPDALETIARGAFESSIPTLSADEIAEKYFPKEPVNIVPLAISLALVETTPHLATEDTELPQLRFRLMPRCPNLHPRWRRSGWLLRPELAERRLHRA
jgi:hypothetical protein